MAARRIVGRLGGWLFRHGAKTAIQSMGEATSQIGQRAFRQVFTIRLPATVYVYAVYSRVTVRRKAGNCIEVEAALRGSFGLNLTVEQDEAGIYVIAKRKPVAGALARADFTLIVPPEVR